MSVRASIPSILNAFFSATAGLNLTKVGTNMSIDNGSMNHENYDEQSYGPDTRLKRSCLYVSIFLSVTHFSATPWPIWTKLGRKVGTVSAFMNPENQDEQSHGPDFTK